MHVRSNTYSLSSQKGCHGDYNIYDILHWYLSRCVDGFLRNFWRCSQRMFIWVPTVIGVRASFMDISRDKAQKVWIYRIYLYAWGCQFPQIENFIFEQFLNCLIVRIVLRFKFGWTDRINLVPVPGTNFYSRVPNWGDSAPVSYTAVAWFLTDCYFSTGTQDQFLQRCTKLGQNCPSFGHGQ